MEPEDFATYSRVVYAKNQPEYLPLPAKKWKDGTVVTKWRLDWKERLHCLIFGFFYLKVQTRNRPLQPLRPSIFEPIEHESDLPSSKYETENSKS